MRFDRLVAVALLLAAVRLDAASPVKEQARPRIALALEGGAARGIAHVGVLQWLEEHRIPVDYIAGTSMGGLIGGTYATGLTADEVRDLPIPFRCVATDIEKGEVVILEDGSLAQALRATMAIPAIFAPVRRQGRLLVDGGALNNLPVDVAREMGAEIVVASNLVTRKELTDTSLFGLAGRAIDVMIAQTVKRNLPLADIVVRSDIVGLDAMDWRKLDELVERGYAGAEAQADALLVYALDEAAWREHLAARAARKREAITEADFVAVVGVPERDAERLRSRLEERLTEGPLDLDEVESELTLVVGKGRFESGGPNPMS